MDKTVKEEEEQVKLRTKRTRKIMDEKLEIMDEELEIMRPRVQNRQLELQQILFAPKGSKVVYLLTHVGYLIRAHDEMLRCESSAVSAGTFFGWRNLLALVLEDASIVVTDPHVRPWRILHQWAFLGRHFVSNIIFGNRGNNLVGCWTADAGTVIFDALTGEIAYTLTDRVFNFSCDGALLFTMVPLAAIELDPVFVYNCAADPTPISSDRQANAGTLYTILSNSIHDAVRANPADPSRLTACNSSSIKVFFRQNAAPGSQKAIAPLRFNTYEIVLKDVNDINDIMYFADGKRLLIANKNSSIVGLYIEPNRYDIIFRLNFYQESFFDILLVSRPGDAASQLQLFSRTTRSQFFSHTANRDHISTYWHSGDILNEKSYTNATGISKDYTKHKITIEGNDMLERDMAFFLPLDPPNIHHHPSTSCLTSLAVRCLALLRQQNDELNTDRHRLPPHLNQLIKRQRLE